MSKVIEKKLFIILLIACYIVIFSVLAKAGGMGSKMGGTTAYTNLYSTSGMSGMGGHSNNTTTYYNSADFYRTNSLLGYPSYNTYSPYGYNYGSSLLSPSYSYAYGSPLSYNYANAYNGLSPLNGLYNNYSWGTPYGGTTSVVTGKNYTTEQSYTTYVPGGEVTTTVAEETETSAVPVSNYFGNLFGNSYYNNPYYGYGYGNTYGSPYLW